MTPEAPNGLVQSGSGAISISPTLQPSTPSPVPIIPDHELLKKIGGGSYGEVWLGRNLVGTLRAIKIVRRQTFDRDEHFEREFRGMQKFEPISRSHEGLVDILQIGRNDGRRYFYYVMELADDAEEKPKSEARDPKEAPTPNTERASEGKPVQNSGLGVSSGFGCRDSDLYSPRTLRADQQRQGRLPVATCVRIGLSLASALAHLHKNRLVHRDVKPSNIIFVNGEVKLADIGLVADASEARSFVGTDGFIPPEGPGLPQADIYSLGKVLYEISTGKDRKDYPALPSNLREHPESEQQELLELNAILVRACASDPRSRYKSAEELGIDLGLLRRGKSVRRKRTVEQRLGRAKKVAVAIILAVLVLATLLWVPRLERHKAPKPEVLRLYQLSRLHLDKATKEGKQQALECINRALQIDPRFVPGYATLLEIYFWDGLIPDQDKKIRDCARKLMEIDGTLAESHTAMSWVKFMDRDWEGAEREINLAIKRNPNFALAPGVYGFYLALLGRAGESQAQFKRSQELDPSSRDLAATAGYAFLAARQYEQAISQVRKALALDPNWAAAHQFLAQIYEDWGKFEEAIREFEKSELLSTREPARVLEKYNLLRLAYHDDRARGYWLKKRDLMEMLGEFVDVKDLPGERSYYLAKLYAHLGDKEHALDDLEQSRTEPQDMVMLKVEPCWDLVRDEPRFIALLKQAGLEK